jgi:biotin carboxylase
MSARGVRGFRDKALMKDLLVQAGLPCARYRLIDDPAQGLAFARQIGFPLIAKPPAGVRAESTVRLDDERALGDCMRSLAVSRERPLLLEEHIAGEEHSFDSAVIGGRVVWHSIVDYHPAARGVAAPVHPMDRLVTSRHRRSLLRTHR